MAAMESEKADAEKRAEQAQEAESTMKAQLESLGAKLVISDNIEPMSQPSKPSDSTPEELRVLLWIQRGKDGSDSPAPDDHDPEPFPFPSSPKKFTPPMFSSTP